MSDLAKKGVKESRGCECNDWQVNAEKLIDQALFCHLHSGGPRYDGPQFDYCPWCGKELK